MAALWSRRTSGAGRQLWPEADAAGVEAAEHRRGERLRERYAEPRRADDRDRLEHRGRARSEAEPGAAPLGNAGERHAAGQRYPEAAGGSGAGGQEGDDPDVRRPDDVRRCVVRPGVAHEATVAGAGGAPAAAVGGLLVWVPGRGLGASV